MGIIEHKNKKFKMDTLKPIFGYDFIKRHQFLVQLEIDNKTTIKPDESINEALKEFSNMVESVNIAQENPIGYKGMHYIDVFFYRQGTNDKIYAAIKKAYLDECFISVKILILNTTQDIITQHNFISPIHDFFPFITLSYSNDDTLKLNSKKEKFSLEWANKDYVVKSKIRFLASNRDIL